MRATRWLVLLLLWPLTAAAESMVWEVETRQGALYLAGSIHVLRPGDYPLPREFEAAYADAERLVFETDLKALDPERVQQLMLTQGVYPQGKNLKADLSAETYQALAAYCRERGIPLAPLERMKPWTLVLTLTVMELQSLGFGEQSGVDAHLYARAVADGKAVGGLESPEEHLMALSALDQGLGDAMVKDFLREMENLPSMLDELVAAWRSGDEQTLARITADGFPAEAKALEEALLTGRNRRWIAAIENLAKSGEDTLVVVGSAHLVGEESVVELLRSRGFTVRKLAL